MDFSTLCATCRSIRRFQQKPVPAAVLEEILEEVRIESSGMNKQVMRFAVITEPELVKSIQPFFHFAAALPPEIGQPKEGEQPTAFMILASENGRGRLTLVDVGIAARTLQLGAWAHGVASCIMANVEFPKVAAAVGLPDSWKPELALALGYPAHKSTVVPLPEDGDVRYTVDENRDYYVPKRKLEDILLKK
jgi:FMN reductase [NAD(P)H]